MIGKLLQAAAQERPIKAILFIFGKVVDRLRGRAMASIFGWPDSYVGVGSKVLGTRAIKVGAGAYINRYAWIEAVHSFGGRSFQPVIVIGRGFAVSDRLHISSINRIEIGDNCLFGSGVYIGDHNHGSYKGAEPSTPAEPPVMRRLVSMGPVIIGSNVWLGDNVVVLGPVTIGNGVVIGANSVVTHDLPDNVLVAGAPVRILKQFSQASGKWERYVQ